MSSYTSDGESPNRGKILVSDSGSVVVGSSGFPLVADLLLKKEGGATSILIAISWTEQGKDLDTYTCLSVSTGQGVGYSQSREVSVTVPGSDSKVNLTWDSSDSTAVAGTETVSVKTDDRLALAWQQIHVSCNFYGRCLEGTRNDDDDDSCTPSGGPATITVSGPGAGGTAFSGSVTVYPSTNYGSPASYGDPGAVVNFDRYGYIESIS